MNQANTEELVEIAILGEQVKIFWTSRVGQYLLARIEDEVESGIKGLKSANPEDVKKIRDLQNIIWRAESINRWLSDIISSGIEATKVLEQRDE